MRKNIFAKAKYLTNHTKLISETDHSIILKVGKFQVIAKYQNHTLLFLCECKAGSLMKPCAHILAAISYLNNGIITKENKST